MVTDDQRDHGKPDLLAAVRACSSLRELEIGRKIYTAIGSWISTDVFVSTAFVDMFAKCGDLMEAKTIFDGMISHDVVSWNALMLGCVLHGEDNLALDLFRQMRLGSSPDARTFVAALKACSHKAEKEEAQRQTDGKLVKVACLRLGTEIHCQAAAAGFASEIFVASTLVDLYSKCGSMIDARKVFDRLPCHDVVLWTALLVGYVASGEAEEALLLFERIRSKQLNSRTFTAAIMACASLGSREEGKQVDGKIIKARSLDRGREIHCEAAKLGFSSDLIVGNCLVEMYAKCGSMIEAREVFDGMPRRSVVSWNSLMMGYVENDQAQVALQIFQKMQKLQQQSEADHDSVLPNARSFVIALTACTGCLAGVSGGVFKRIHGKLVNLSCLEKGMEIHSQAAKMGFDSDVFVANTLIDLYGKCGSLEDAFTVFRRIHRPDVVSWTALISGCTNNGDCELALEIFSQLKDFECQPNPRTYVAALMACASSAAEEFAKEIDGKFLKVACLDTGRRIHCEAAENKNVDVFVANALITMYSKCGSLIEAREVFEGIAQPDVVSWNTMISAFAENDEPEQALSLFSQVRSPDSRTYVGALMACSGLAAKEEGEKISSGKLVKIRSLEKGMNLHSQAARSGCSCDLFVGNILIGMYTKCGSLLDARIVFDRMQSRSSVTWTCMISSYVEDDQSELGLQLFECMLASSSDPDSRSFLAASFACSCLASKETGRLIDGKLVKSESLGRARVLLTQATSKCGLSLDGFLGNSFITMFARCGSTADSRAVFDGMQRRDVVSWTALIIGYVENDQGGLAMQTFKRMRSEGGGGCELDARGLAAVLMACGSVVDREMGRMIHADVCRRDAVLGNYLVDFYGKCGSLDAAQEVFDSIADDGDVVAWNALIAGYSHNGNAEKVFEVFERMRRRGVKANEITFVSLLKVCSHGGLVERGKKYLEDMWLRYEVRPGIQHYSCVVDMLGRANRIQDAVAMAGVMPFQADVVTWTAILGACYMWKDVETGRVALDNLKRLEDEAVLT